MPSQFLKRLRWLLLGGIVTAAAQATVYPLPPPDNDVVGEVKVVHAQNEETLLDIARAHSLGYDEIVHANPGVDRWAPGEKTPIVLPTRYILPDTPREGIVLNIAEMRVYYYPAASAGGERVVHTYPVSIGRMDWKTPLGLTKVVAKDVDPPWRPPASIKAEHAAEGDILPDVVPGGPDNPLGRFAMRLGVPGYLIHGTNKPFGIGMRVTHGCVRMYPEDIEHLFGIVPVGTPVRLIDQPVKVGRLNGEWLVEAHEPLEEDNLPMKVTLEQAQQAVAAKVGADMPGVNPSALQAAVETVSGMPVSISGEPGSPSTGSFAYATPRPAPASNPMSEPRPTPAPASMAAPRPTPEPLAAPRPAPVDSPVVSREPIPYPTPDQYTPPAAPVGAAAPAYPVAASRPAHPYASPNYGSTAAPPPVYRPAPVAPPRYTPLGYGNSATAVYQEPPYRHPVTAPPAPPSPSMPVDTPAYRSPVAASPGYAPNPGAANYPQEPPYSYAPTTAATPPTADYRPVPQGSPIPYPRPVTPTTQP
ncbi:MAG: L,D-transpeptidase family protein [Candidatus Competibacteraceae bacterium]|nr:L,D-transpeptidase family protein [Candidatus Competibacteraceae bacterium]